MLKRMMCLFLLAALLPLTGLCAPATERRVFDEGETEPFPADARLLTVRVCPLLGADCMLLTLGEDSLFVDLGRKTHMEQIHALIDAAELTEVDAVFNTHPHDDHIGGLKPLLEEGFPIGALYTVFPHDYFEPAQIVIQKQAIAAAERFGVPVIDLRAGNRVPFGDAELTVCRVPEEMITPGMSCNNLSAMLMVRYGDCSILLAADVEINSQAILAREYPLKADILKYPHHGVNEANVPFLRAVDPEYVVFTHGTINTADAQKQLKKLGYTRMTFATWGMITLQTDGEKWIVRQDISPDLVDYAEKYRREHF